MAKKKKTKRHKTYMSYDKEDMEYMALRKKQLKGKSKVLKKMRKAK